MTNEQTNAKVEHLEDAEKWEEIQCGYAEIQQGYKEIRQEYVRMRKMTKWVILVAVIAGCFSFCTGRYIGKHYHTHFTSVEVQSKCQRESRESQTRP